ncbi:hypothetical protein [Haloferax sp. YSSS75]|uniref:hypothetical protein n=1 Tax=Haloferax sp. YSSS75 TaxID=3388564 RepID=UPI00398CA841
MTDPTEADSNDAKRVVHTYGEDVKRRELQLAFNRLEAKGTLTDEQRATVSQMASAIVEGVLGPTLDALEEAPACDDTAQTVVELLDADDPSGSL